MYRNPVVFVLGRDLTLAVRLLLVHRVQRRRAIEALEARAPQYCDCGPDWPLLFKVHEI